MYPVASNFHNLAIQDAPNTRIRIYLIDDTVDCTDDNDVQTNGTLLVSAVGDTDSNKRIAQSGAKFDDYFNPDKNVQVGTCVSSQVNLPLLNLDGALTGYQFGRCKIYLDVYDATNLIWLPCPMGVYLLEQPVNTNQKIVAVHGYDQMQLLDTPAGDWYNTLSWSLGLTLYDLLDSMTTYLGISLSSDTATAMANSFVSYSVPPIFGAEMTYREILRLIAEASCTVARFNRDGALDLKWFEAAQAGSGQQTYTGQTLSIVNSGSATLDSLSIPITPTQNLNGYSKPWAGGSGKNKAKLTAVSAGVSLISDLTDNSVTVYNTTTSAGYKYKRFSVLSAQQYAGQTLRFSAKASVAAGATTPRIVCRLYEADGTTTVGSNLFELIGTSFSRSITLPATIADGVILCLNLYSDSGNGGANEISYSDIQFEVASTATDFEPYSNVCPITGLSSLSAYVSPTQNQADATNYALSFTEVIAGSIDPVLGVIKRRPVYSSYNGETLTGPWLSSLDEYASGTTPTTGAQVVDLGGTETPESITPTAITLLSGQNYIWASNSATLTALVSEITVVTIDADTLGSQCLSLNVAEYEAAEYGHLYFKAKPISTHVDTSPAGDNEYWIVNNGLIRGIATYADIETALTNILQRLSGIGAYSPISARVITDWSLESGDIINIVYGGVTYTFPIFQQSMVWRGGYVVSDMSNDGDVIAKYTEGSAEYVEDKSSVPEILKFTVLPQFSWIKAPGEDGTIELYPESSALIILAAEPFSSKTAKDVIIVHCGALGEVTFSRLVTHSTSGLTYTATNGSVNPIVPGKFTIVNDNTSPFATTQGVCIKF